MESTKNLIFIFFFSTILYGCATDTRNDVYFIDVRKAVKSQEQIFLLSELATQIEYIPLETHQNVLLQEIQEITLLDDFIFIRDSQSVYQFNIQGKFIRQLGAVGNGPGEYTGAIRFALDEVNNEVLIHCLNLRILKVYDLASGDFLYDRQMPFLAMGLSILPGGNPVIFTGDFNQRGALFNLNEVYMLNREKQLIDSIANASRVNFNTHIMGSARVFSDSKHVYYQYNFRDTLYKIDQDFNRATFAVYRLGNSKDKDNLDILPTNEIQHPDFLWVSRVLACKNKIFLTANLGLLLGNYTRDHRIIYNTTSGTLSRVASLNNDLDNGLPFWPDWVKDNILITIYNPSEILEFYTHGDGKKQQKPEVLYNLDENSNPVVVLVK
jgi:hypothetical protein